MQINLVKILQELVKLILHLNCSTKAWLCLCCVAPFMKCGSELVGSVSSDDSSLFLPNTLRLLKSVTSKFNTDRRAYLRVHLLAQVKCHRSYSLPFCMNTMYKSLSLETLCVCVCVCVVVFNSHIMMVFWL